MITIPDGPGQPSGQVGCQASGAPELRIKKMWHLFLAHRKGRVLGYIATILGLYWDNGKENGNYYNRIYIGTILGGN